MPDGFVRAGLRIPGAMVLTHQTDHIDSVGIGHLQEADLLEAGRLMLRSSNLQRKNAGLSTSATRLRRPVPMMQHLYSQDPDLSWAAYDGDKLAGFLISYVRDRQWYVGYFSVDPAYQGTGIGQDLLEAGLAKAQEMEMYFLSQCTFTYDLGAVGLCSQLGMFPRKNLFRLGRPSQGNWTLPTPPESLSMSRISSIETMAELNRMDCEVRGVNRAADHCYWLADEEYAGYVFSSGDRLVGYAYVSNIGTIGPVLVSRDMYLTDILTYCLTELITRNTKEIRLWVSGKNFGALQLLLANDFEFEETAILMTNRVFCDLRRYLPHSLVVF
jgi:GNAT superfamily N-acetyltransferase